MLSLNHSLVLCAFSQSLIGSLRFLSITQRSSVLYLYHSLVLCAFFLSLIGSLCFLSVAHWFSVLSLNHSLVLCALSLPVIGSLCFLFITHWFSVLSVCRSLVICDFCLSVDLHNYVSPCLYPHGYCEFRLHRLQSQTDSLCFNSPYHSLVLCALSLSTWLLRVPAAQTSVTHWFSVLSLYHSLVLCAFSLSLIGSLCFLAIHGPTSLCKSLSLSAGLLRVPATQTSITD